MFIEDLDDLTSGQPERMLAAYSALKRHVELNKEIDAQSRRDFGVLGSQLGDFDKWPEAEQLRFRRLAQGIRAAFLKGSVFDKQGRVFWPGEKR